MPQKKLSELTNDELLLEAKKMKKYKTYDAVIFGFLVGVSIYSVATNGFDLLTFLPLVYLPIAGRNKIRRKEVDKIMEERGLKKESV